MIRTRTRTSRARAGAIAGAALSLLCFGCSGGGSGDNNVQLESFVLDQIAQTAEDTDPVPINGLNFVSNEDPAAFDGLFP